MACGVQDGGMFEAELTCPVCLDVYRDPHQLPCGHNFCLLCLNQLKRRGQVCCPECRKSYSASTHWQKNFKLSNIAEEFRRHGSSPQSHLERPGLSGKAGGVRCDFCPPEGGTALKTCLKCEVSMCGEHLRPHLELQAFLEHPLVEPQNGLKKRKCEEHEEMFRYYCREDRSFLCNACTIEGGHSGHNVKTLKNTMKHFKMSLNLEMQKVTKKMRKVENNLKDQKEEEHQSKASLEGAKERLEVLRGSLMNSLNTFLNDLSSSLLSQEEPYSTEIQQNLATSQKHQNRLSEVHAEMERMQQENDPMTFIREYQSSVKRYRQVLRRPLTIPKPVERNLGHLSKLLRGRHNELVSELQQNINEFIQSLGPGDDEEDEDDEEEYDDENVEDDEDEDDEDDEDEDDEDEDDENEDDEDEDDENEDDEDEEELDYSGYDDYEGEYDEV